MLRVNYSVTATMPRCRWTDGRTVQQQDMKRLKENSFNQPTPPSSETDDGGNEIVFWKGRQLKRGRKCIPDFLLHPLDEDEDENEDVLSSK